MNKRKLFIFLILICIKNNLFALEHLSETENKINNVKLEIEKDITENGFNTEKVNENFAFGNDGTRLSLKIEKGHENTGVYNWVDNTTPLIKILNNGVIKNNTNTIRLQNPKYVYIENNGTIGSNAVGGKSNQEAVYIINSLTGKTYIKNNGIIENNDNQRNIDDTMRISNLNLDNYNKIINHSNETALIAFRTVNIINRENAEIIAKKDPIHLYGKGNFVNKGLIKGVDSEIYPSDLFKFTNDGKIESNLSLITDETNPKSKIEFKNNNLIKGNIKFSGYNESLFDTRNAKIDGDFIASGDNSKLIIDDKTNITGNVDGNEKNTLVIYKGIDNLNKYKNFNTLELIDAKIENNINNSYVFFNSIKINENSKLNLKNSNINANYIENLGNIIINEDSIIYGKNSLKNKGKITFNNNTLRLPNKNYIGDNGILKMNVSDNSNSSLITKESSGKTKIVLNNQLTKKIDEDGIMLIENKFSTPDAFYLDDSSKEKGVHTYKLVRKDNYNWYLLEFLNNKIGIYGVISNSIKELLNNRLEDRLGNLNNNKNNPWSNISYAMKNNTLYDFNLNSNIYQMKVGKNIKNWDKNNFNINLGGFGTIGGDVSTSNNKSESNLNMLLLGAYSTIQNKEKKLVIDLWANYGLGSVILKNNNNKEKLITQGWAISSELNKDFLLKNNTYLQYQGQITYQGTNIPDINTGDNKIKNVGNHNLQIRTGFKLYSNINGFVPYISGNFITNTTRSGIQINEKDKYLLKNSKNLGEIKVGFDNIDLNKNLKIHANFSTLFSKNKFIQNKLVLGLKYTK